MEVVIKDEHGEHPEFDAKVYSVNVQQIRREVRMDFLQIILT